MLLERAYDSAAHEYDEVAERIDRRADARGILDHYAVHGPVYGHAGRKAEVKVVYPRVFSLIENPDQTLEVIAELVSACTTSSTKVVALNQSRCHLLDHGAESVMHSLALEAKQLCGIGFAGRVPASEDQARIVRATGLAKQLRLEGWSSPEIGFHALELRRGQREPAQARHSTQKEIQTYRLAQYFNECLRKFGFELTRHARGRLCELVGEVIGNAEEHSRLGVWYLAAYLRMEPARTHADCHITLFNYGKSLAESLSELPPDSKLGRDIGGYVARHSRGRKSISPECALTVLALQQGVSRYNTDPEELGDRGQGTVRMIEFFQQIGCTEEARLDQRMCLVSGRAHILFDGSHRMRAVRGPSGEERMIIAFNDSNDLEAPPDRRYVRRLRRRFPGTIISMRFHLEAEHLSSLGGEE